MNTEIIMATCPIPSHPSTLLISTAITFLRHYPAMESVPILIYCDGVHPALQHRAEQYAQYKQNLKDLNLPNVRILESDTHIHQCNVMRNALEEVKTDTVLVASHGWLFFGEVPWEKLFDAMRHPDVNSIRFYIFDDIHPDHAHLFGEREMVNDVPLMKTIQFADGPAIYKTQWLKDAIQKYVNQKNRCFNEQILWPVFHNLGWKGWDGLWIYAPERLNRNVIINERETDKTPPQHIEP